MMWHFTEYPVKKEERNLNLFIYRKKDIDKEKIIKPQISLKL